LTIGQENALLGGAESGGELAIRGGEEAIETAVVDADIRNVNRIGSTGRRLSPSGRFRFPVLAYKIFVGNLLRFRFRLRLRRLGLGLGRFG
jgi:hypothetical protein